MRATQAWIISAKHRRRTWSKDRSRNKRSQRLAQSWQQTKGSDFCKQISCLFFRKNKMKKLHRKTNLHNLFKQMCPQGECFLQNQSKQESPKWQERSHLATCQTRLRKNNKRNLWLQKPYTRRVQTWMNWYWPRTRAVETRILCIHIKLGWVRLEILSIKILWELALIHQYYLLKADLSSWANWMYSST